jgi:hypothetical protein
MNKSAIFLALLLAIQILSFIPFGYLNLPIFIGEAQAAPTLTEISCSTITQYPNGTGIFSTRKCRVWDGNSWEKWHVNQGFGADDTTYQIANGKIGYELHKDFGNLTYYNPSFNETRVTMEHWTVEVNTGGVWHDTLVHTVEPSVSYHSNSSGLYLTMVKEKNDLRLELVHVIEEGLPMKHNLNIKSTNSTSYEYRLVQNWDGIQDATQIVQRGGMISTTTALGSEVNSSASNGHTFIFRDSSGNDIVEESQISARGQFHHVLYGLSNGHGYAKYYFQNPTNQTLASGEHFTVDPATTTISRDSSSNTSGVYLGTNSASPSNLCNGMDNWYDDSAHGVVQAGIEDSGRCYVEKLIYDLSSISTAASVTKAEFNIGGVNTGYCRGSGGASGYGGCPLIKITYVPNSMDDCVNSIDSDLMKTLANTPSSHTPASIVALANGNPKSTWDGTDIELTHASSQVNSYITADIAAGGEACFGFSQTGEAEVGGPNDFFQWTFPDLTLTWVIPTEHTQTIVLKTSDGSTALDFGDPELEIQMTNGTTLSYTNCVSGGTIGTCEFTTAAATGDSSWEIRGKWANTGTPVAVMIEGKPSHNITVTSTQSHTLDLSLHKGTKMMFYDNNGALASPQNVTTNFGNGTAKNFATYDSEGARTISWVTNGTNTVEAVYRLGANRILNGTSTFAVTADSQSFSFKQRVYLIDFVFTNVDRELQGITPTSISFGVNNGTVGDTFTKTSFSNLQFGNDTITVGSIRWQGSNMIINGTGHIIADNTNLNWVLGYYKVPWHFKSNDHALSITPAGFTFAAPNSTNIEITDFTKDLYFANGTITPQGVTYQGSGVLKNTTGIAISADRPAGYLLNLQYYKLDMVFAAHERKLQNIVPDIFQFQLQNGTEIVLQGPSGTNNILSGLYYVNQTLTPEGITFNGQGVLQNTTAYAISVDDKVEWIINWFELEFQFYSQDGELDITPTNMQLQMPNGTVIVMTDDFILHFVGNGTITPQGITYQGQGMIKNQTGFSVTTADAFSFPLRYYKQNMVFTPTDNAFAVIPTNFQVVLTNSSEKTITTDFDSVYVGNGTLTPRGITYNGQGMILNTTAHTVVGDSTGIDGVQWYVQYYKVVVTFVSDNEVLQGISAQNFQYTASNGTIITQTAHYAAGVYIGNGTLTPRGITYQGTGMIKNQTALTVDGAKSWSFKLRYYPIDFTFTSDDRVLQGIVPQSFHFNSVNGSEVTVTTAYNVYLGNGTITPKGIQYLDQGMIHNNTAIVISAADNYSLRLKLYNIVLNFASIDSALKPTPSQITYQAPNGTNIAQTAYYDGSYIGNGTLTPQGITYQNTGMILNNTAFTIDASETHLLRMKYLAQGFTFRATMSGNVITPTNFIITLANGTQTTLTAFTFDYYLGNQSVASVDAITVGSLDAKQNSTGFTVSTNGQDWLFWTLECCTIDFKFYSHDRLFDFEPTTFEFDMGNGTYVSLTSFDSVQFSDSDTVTPRAIRFLGQNMILNSTAFSIDDSSGLSQTFSIRVQLFDINWDFASVDSELDLFTTLTNWQYVAPNGTAITQTTHLVGSYIGNGTLSPVTLKYDGQGILVNNTAITIDASETHLIRGQWYKLNFDFMSNDRALTIPDAQMAMTFLNTNGSNTELTSDLGNFYVGNGTITPQGITFLGQGMINNNTVISISDANCRNIALLGRTCGFSFRMQYYNISINLLSNNAVLVLDQTNFKAVVSNTTIPFTATHKTIYLGNSTLTPHVFTFQGQNIISNMTAITIDSDTTFHFYGRYYNVSMHFLTDNGTNFIPAKFIYNLSNGTEIDQSTSFGSGVYISNQTLTPHTILYHAQSVHLNQTAINIIADGVISFRTQVYHSTLVFISADHLLYLIPTEFILIAPNGTEITITDFTQSYLVGNGTITPKNIEYQGTNMIENQTAVTINTSREFLFNVKYYAITMNFATVSINNVEFNVVPTHMLFTGANATQTNATMFASSIYLGNQTGLIVNAIYYQGSNMNLNASSITISGAGEYLFRVQYYPVQIQMTTFNLNATSLSGLGIQLRVEAINGTTYITSMNSTGGRMLYLGNGTSLIGAYWNGIRVSPMHSHYIDATISDSLPTSNNNNNATHNAVWIPIQLFQDKIMNANIIFALENSDINCQTVGRSNSSCVSFSANRLTFDANNTARTRLVVLLTDQSMNLREITEVQGLWWNGTATNYIPATEAECVGSSYNGTWSGTTCTTTWNFPDNSWNWNSGDRVFRIDIPFQSGLNFTIAIPGTVSYGGSNFSASLSQSQACLVDGELICALTSPYTNSQSGLGQWFYTIMMALPPIMVFIRTGSVGPFMVILWLSIWVYGAFAPLVGGGVLLPPATIWLSYTILALSLTATVYKLLKRQ